MAPLDELLLAEAREAQAAQVHAQAQAELARVRLAEALRRLHHGGASMREIGGAIGLSHQRVHQIVTGDDGGRRVRCSFCGATTPTARKLVAGPDVFVCDACVALASGTLAGDPAAEQRWAAQRTSSPAPQGRRRSQPCSFCGKGPEQVRGMAYGGGSRICSECLDLCREIIAEELGGG